MSEPTRYSIVADHQPPWAKMHEFSAGGWVKWEDYASLKAEVERLRKAGDELLHEWSSGDETNGRNFMKSLVIWTAAKEGKQS